MITLFRRFAKSKWAWALFAMLVVGLVVTGGSQMDVFRTLGSQNVIDAGDRSLSPAEFRTEFDRAVDRVVQQSAQAGQPVTREQLIEQGAPAQFLEQQTEDLGFLAWAWKVGIRPGHELIQRQLADFPGFVNQVTGAFDENQYRQTLAAQNFTPQTFERGLRDDEIKRHFGTAVVAGVRPPRLYSALLATENLATRDAHWFVVTPASIGEIPAPTDQQLTGLMDEDADRWQEPEARQGAMVLFTPDQPDEITEDRIRERFEFARSSLSQPERRTFVTFTTRDRAAADRVAAALRAGRTNEQAGQAGGTEPAVYNDSARSVLTDAAIAGLVFGMSPDQVSDPTQTAQGWTVAKLAAVAPGHEATLENSRDQIVQALREADLRQSIYDKVEAFEQARQQGKTLLEAAEQVGARTQELPAITREGVTEDGRRLPAPPQLLEALFTLSEGEDSDVIDAGQSQYFAVRLVSIKPAARLSLDDVRPIVTQQWRQREMARRLSARAEELAQRVRGGEDIAAVARSANLTLVTRQGLGRNQETFEALGQQAATTVLSQSRNVVFVASTQQGQLIGQVTAIHAPDTATAARMSADPRVSQGLTQAFAQDVLGSVSSAASSRVGARNDQARMRAALNIQDDASPAAPAEK